MRGRSVAAVAFAFAAGLINWTPSALAQGWQYVAPLPTARFSAASATLGDRWYVAGGLAFIPGKHDVDGEWQIVSSVVAYDPQVAKWTVVGDLSQPRYDSLAVIDRVGARVLFLSGVADFAGRTVSVCDVLSGETLAPLPCLQVPRIGHAAAFALDKVVVTGGQPFRGRTVDYVEIAAADVVGWTSGGKMPGEPKLAHTMTTMANGRDILVAGGAIDTGIRVGHEELHDVVSTADLFDAASVEWIPAAPLSRPRAWHKAALLEDGRVLVAGGRDTNPGAMMPPLSSAELFDPVTKHWTPAARMRDARWQFDMARLPDGRVIVAGGSSASGPLRSVEIYDPAADVWVEAPPMRDPRASAVLAVLSDGIYVAGGDVPGLADKPLDTVERLAWADVPKTAAVDHDAGAGTTPDGGSSTESPDATTDGAAGSTTDAAFTSAMQLNSGCSCTIPKARSSCATSALPWLAVLVMLLRRSRRPEE